MAANIKPLKTGPVTARRDVRFFDSNSKAIFSVNEGIPLGAAFDQLTVLLSSAHAVVEALAMAAEDSTECGAYWAPAHLLTFANALVEAMHTGHLEGKNENHHRL